MAMRHHHMFILVVVEIYIARVEEMLLVGGVVQLLAALCIRCLTLAHRNLSHLLRNPS